MSEQLSDLDLHDEELWTLADGLYSGQLTAEQRARLEDIIAKDDAAAAFCAAYANMHAMLRWRFRPIEPDATFSPESHSVDASEQTVSASVAASQPSRNNRIVPVLFSNAVHSTIGFFSQEVPFSILIAAIITGLGLWFGSLVHVTHHEQLARRVSRQPSTMTQIIDKPNAEYVAHITAIVDVKWKKEGLGIRGQGLDAAENQELQIPNPRSLVAMGDRFALSAGLVEITYNTGAKVILQGPATYTVESRDGGYLSLGKLTATLEKKGDARDGRKLDSNPQSLISNSSLSTIHYPLFTIKTPTATVTDLGTEFGVEVKESGVTSAHVFRGVVEVQPTGKNGRRGQAVRLIENEAVQIDGFDSDEPIARRVVLHADTFVRSERLIKIAQQRGNKTTRQRLLEWPVLHKTLVAWVSLDDLDQKGVGIMSLLNMPEWDGIVYGELDPRKWMGGSHGYTRTQKEQSAYPAESTGPSELVQIAIVYDWTTVTIYRNGKLYAAFDAGDRHVYKKDMTLLLGKRHLPMFEGNELPTLAGKVEEARFYDFAMSPETVASLKPGEPSPIPPVGWWTFEDGTARDSTGHFPVGELHGNAKITNGKLILDGKDSYLLVPAAMALPSKPATDSKPPTLVIPTTKEETKVKN